jgi:uncharacterized protein YaeQ
VALSVTGGTVAVTLGDTGAIVSAGASDSRTLTLSGTVAQVNAALETLVYQGDLHFNGNDTLTVVTTDGGGLSDTDTVVLTVNAVNDAPTLTTPEELSYTDTAAVDTFASATGTLVGVDVDTGSTLTFGIIGGVFENGVVTQVSTHGALAVVAGTGMYTFTPNASAINALSASAAETFVVTVSDGTATTAANLVINLTAVNDAPTLTTVSTLTGATEDTALTVSYATLAAAANEADVDGPSLSFQIEAVSSGTLTKGGAAVSAGTTLLSSGESLVWTPAANAHGTLNAFTVKAWDGTLASASAVPVTVEISAVNDAPTIVAGATLEYTEGVRVVVESGGSALTLNGTSQYLLAGTASDHVLTTGTIECWIKTGDAGWDYRGIIVKQMAFGLFLKYNQLVAYDWKDAREISTGRMLNDNAWHHVAMSFQSGVTGGTVIYLDGVAVLNTTYTVVKNDVALVVGSGFDKGGQFFAGMIDEIRIWNSVRSAEEIANNKNSSVAANSPGLISYFKLDETSGDIALNTVSSVVNGTVVGGATWTALSPSAITPSLSLSDIDDTVIATGASVSIASGYSEGDILSIPANSLLGGVIANYNDGVLTFSGTASINDYQTMLQAVGYNTTSHHPTSLSSTRSIIYSVTDVNAINAANGAQTSTATSTVTITAVNDAPVLALSEASMQAIEQVAVVLDGKITVSDADNSTLASATLTLSGGYLSGEDVLGYVGHPQAHGNISGSFAADTGVLTLTSPEATATLAQWQEALRSVTYLNTSDAPNTSTRTVTVVVNDGSLASAAVTKTVEISAVNDAPVNQVHGAHSVPEETAFVFTGSNAISVTDTDSASLTVALSVTGGTVAVTLGDTGAIVSAGASDSTTLTLSGTVAQVNAALKTLVYQGDLHFNGNDTLTVVTTDDGGLSDTDTVYLTVNAVNDAPTLTTPEELSYTDTATLDTFASATGILVGVDVDTGSTLTYGIIGGVFENGVVTQVSTYGALAVVAETGMYTFTPNASAINALSTSTTEVLVVSVNDGSVTATANLVINLTGVNDAPTLTTVSTLTGGTEDSALTISYATLAAAANAADVDGHSLSFQIEAVSSGTLTKNGTAVIAGTTRVSSGESLVWTPATNAHGTLNAFTVKAWDGALASANAVPVTAEISAVNDAPVLALSQSSMRAIEQVAVVLDGRIIVSDVDNATLASATVTLSGEYRLGEDVLGYVGHPQAHGNISGSFAASTGVLTLTSVGATATLAQWQEALRSVTYLNTSDAPNTSTRTVTVVVNDGSLASAAVTKTVVVDSVPDGQTVSFADVGDVIYGVGSVPLTVSSSSGLPVTLEVVRGPGRISGSSLEILGAGFIVVRASQMGDGTWDPASPVERSVTVAKRELTVTNPVVVTKVYDGTTSATITGTLAGVLNSDAVAMEGTGTFANKNVGSRQVVTSTSTLSGRAAGNYTLIQPTDLTGTITAKALSIGAPTIKSKVYDGTTAAGPVTVGELSGLVNSETLTVTGAAAAYSSAAVGTYDDVAVTYTLANGSGNDAGLASNYSLAEGTASGTITPAALWITVDPLSLTQDYDGKSHAILWSTQPAGIPVEVLYNGSTTAPQVAGTYDVKLSSLNPNFRGAITVTLTIRTTIGGIALTSGVVAAGLQPVSDPSARYFLQATLGQPIAGSMVVVSGVQLSSGFWFTERLDQALNLANIEIPTADVADKGIVTLQASASRSSASSTSQIQIPQVASSLRLMETRMTVVPVPYLLRVQIHVSGIPGARWKVQSLDGLHSENWQEADLLELDSNGKGSIETDAATGSGVRFYRLVQP